MTIESLSQLSDEELRVKVAEKMGWKPLFYIMKRGLYYRPNGGGYTSCESEAWKVTEDVADKHVYPYDEPVTKHLAPLPPFSTSLDAIHEAEKTLDGLPMDVRSRWLDWLAITAEWPKTKTAADLRFEVQYLTARATARQRAMAFLLV